MKKKILIIEDNDNIREKCAADLAANRLNLPTCEELDHWSLGSHQLDCRA